MENLFNTMSYVFGNDSTSIPDHFVNPNFLKLNVEDTVDNPVLTPSLDIQDSPLPVPHDDISETSSQFNSGCKIKCNGDKIDKDTVLKTLLKRMEAKEEEREEKVCRHK